MGRKEKKRGERGRWRERERAERGGRRRGKRERERERETDRQTDRQTDRDRETEMPERYSRSTCNRAEGSCSTPHAEKQLQAIGLAQQ